MLFYARNIAIVCILALGFPGLLSAQEGKPYDATITIQPLFSPLPTERLFDVLLTRESDRWDKWANLTLSLESKSLGVTGGYNPAIHQIRLVNGTSRLTLVPYSSASMNGYTITPRIVGGKLIITIMGPDSVSDAHVLPNKFDAIRLGTFSLTSTNGSFLADDYIVAQPELFRQANAFKIDHDSVTGIPPNANTWYVTHDNPPLITRYAVLPAPIDDCNAVFTFVGTFAGDKTVKLRFDVNDEHCFEGYYINRALVNRNDPTTLTFEQRPQLRFENEARLKGCTCVDPQVRDNLMDEVEYRRERYAYQLVGKLLPNYGDSLMMIDTAVVYIPNAILSGARILENPFRDQTTVVFNADDRVRVTGKVYDLGGREVAILEDENGVPIVDREYPAGTKYRAKFVAPDVASQGLYNIVLVGTPINDNSVYELSRVIIKGQLLR